MHANAMRMHQLDVPLDAMTSDDVLARLAITIHYSALPQKVFGPFYALATRSMTKVASDVVRTEVVCIKQEAIVASAPVLGARVLAELKRTTRNLGCSVLEVRVARVVNEALQLAWL